MTGSHRVRLATITLVAASATVLAGCGSSGGGSSTPPSQSKIIAKLKSDPTVKDKLGSLVSGNAQAENVLYTCLASVMRKDAPADEVNDYVNGTKSIEEIGQKTSNSKLQTDLENCAQSKAASASPSASG